MQLREGDEVVAMEVVTDTATLLTVCENGYGKRTDVAEYRRQSRGGIGLKNVQSQRPQRPRRRHRLRDGHATSCCS